MSDLNNTGANTPNPFDPSSLRLDQSFADTVGVKKLLSTVPVRKPNKTDFVRVHLDPKYHLTPAAIIELKEESEVYLVLPKIAQQLPGEFSVATLFTTINRQGVVHLWPVAARPRWKAQPMAPVVYGSRRTGDECLAKGHGKSVARRLRHLRGYGHIAGT